MAEKRSNFLLWLVVGGSVFLFFAVSMLALSLYVASGPGGSFSLSSNQVAVLDLEGEILDSKAFVDELRDYGERSGVKAVVLRVNSPGGGVAASQEIFDAVSRFRRETGKPVVVSMASVAASGAYYVACAADRIFANPGTVTGSIGVIAEWYNYGDLLKWAKLQSIVFKSGSFKDTGSPTRPMTEEEKSYFQGLIGNMYGQFVEAVAAGRHMKVDAVRRLADGRVYTGEQARKNGLVDEIGTLRDAVSKAAEMAGIRGDARILSPPETRSTIWDLLTGNFGSLLSLNGDKSESHIRFQYLWR